MGNLDLLHDVLSTLNAANLKEEQLTELLPIWKRYQSGLFPNLGPGATALLQFISYCVEYKLKSETVATAARKLPRLQYKQTHLCSLIRSLESQLSQEECDIGELDEKLSGDQTGLTLDLSKAVMVEERTIGVSMVRRGTASGGVLGRGEVSFPEFTRSDLYQDHFPCPTETLDLVLEGEYEVFGYCGPKLFCM